MRNEFPRGRAFTVTGLVLVMLIGVSIIMLAACSPQAETTAVPDVPQPLGTLEAPVVPSTPDSATGIMRIADIDFASYSRSLAKTVDLEIGESMSAVTPKIETYFSPQSGSIEGDGLQEKTETEFSTFGAQGGKVTLVERVNIKDDSVKAEQFYAIFKAKGEGFVLADYGMKIKCYRGENITNWQAALCP